MAGRNALPAGNHLSFSIRSQQERFALLTAPGPALNDILPFPQIHDFPQSRLANSGFVPIMANETTTIPAGKRRCIRLLMTWTP